MENKKDITETMHFWQMSGEASVDDNKYSKKGSIILSDQYKNMGFSEDQITPNSVEYQHF